MTNAVGVTRRRVIRDGALLGAGALASAAPARAGNRRRRRRPTVAVLGGGVGGLSAAHELAERGFEVTVYERRALGGKARSMGAPGTAKGGRRPLPGEHGMRFFPGFYENLPDTMRRIPFGSDPRGTFGNLVDVPQLSLARAGGREDIVVPLTADQTQGSPEEIRTGLTAALRLATDLPPDELAHFVHRLMVFLSSCDARRLGQWENVSWWDFMSAGEFSEEYRRVLLNSITRQILAAKADAASARTLGLLMEAFVYNLLGRSGTGSFDRVLDAPTNEAWISPWVKHLRSLGVKFRLRREVTRLAMRDGRIAAARVRGPRGTEVARADWYVLAIPVERARRLWTPELLRRAPSLRDTRALRTEWMNAIQFYLREPTPLVRGHILHIDSPWALASLSQSQFWDGRDLARDYGDGSVRDCLSVDIGDFNEPGIVFGRRARDLRPRQIAREVWAQLKAHVNDTGEARLTDDLLVRWFLDPGLVYRRGAKGPRSQDPLFVNTPGSWKRRPEAATGIRNLLLASDYVQVGVDLACMEGANEAARLAVNALLERSRSRAEPCRVYERYRPPEFEALKRVDRVRYERGEPNALELDGLVLEPPLDVP